MIVLAKFWFHSVQFEVINLCLQSLLNFPYHQCFKVSSFKYYHRIIDAAQKTII